MKKIILFKNGIETLGYFSMELAKAFQKMGHQVFIFDLLEEEKSLHNLLAFQEMHNTILVTFNFTGMRGEDIFYDNEGHLFWDSFSIPCINIVVDHPFYYHELLKKRPKQYYQICIDRDHLTYMNRFFPEITCLGFLPLGGTELAKHTSFSPSSDPSSDHSTNASIIFTGNYTPPHTFDSHINRLGQDYAVFYHSVIDTLIAQPHRTMEDVFEDLLLKELGPLSDDSLKDCMANMIFIDLYVRFYFRGEVVKILVDHGFQVHVFGSGWDLLDLKHPENLILGGPVDSKTCLFEISKASISLNVMPWFKNGAHDRIFNTMLNHTLCLTDDSRYLREEFIDGKDICFYSLDALDRLPSIVDFLIKNPASMKSITEAGYEKSKARHTWYQRAVILDSFISRIS